MLRSKRGYTADQTKSEDLDFLTKIVKSIDNTKEKNHNAALDFGTDGPGKENLRGLDFAGKSVADSNLCEVAEHLAVNARDFPRLQSMKLTFNQLTHASMDKLSLCLNKITTIDCLDLAENNIGIKGCTKLSKALREDFRSLLNIAPVALFLPVTRFLRKATAIDYRRCRRRRLLDLACNQICDEGAVEVLLALQRKSSSKPPVTTLVSLGLSENSLSHFCIPALVQYMAATP